MAESGESLSKRVRSLGYPAVDLKTAIDKAKALYQAEGRNIAALPVTFKHWGYSKKSSGGLKTLAALNSFGLINVQGSGENRLIGLSDLALRIILDNREESVDRSRSMATAAINPNIHKKLWSLWGLEPPSFGNMRHHLIFEEGFNENVVEDFIKEYRSTIDYAQLGNFLTSDQHLETEDDFGDIDNGYEPPGNQSENSRFQQTRNRKQRSLIQGHELEKFPVARNCTIILIADGEYSKRSIEALVSQLNLALELGTFDDL